MADLIVIKIRNSMVVFFTLQPERIFLHISTRQLHVSSTQGCSFWHDSGHLHIPCHWFAPQAQGPHDYAMLQVPLSSVMLLASVDIVSHNHCCVINIRYFYYF